MGDDDPGANVSKMVDEAIDDWQHAYSRLRGAQEEERKARMAVSDAVNRLGKLLVPKSAKSGETFNLWVRINQKQERLLCVQVIDGTDTAGEDVRSYSITWREG